MSSTKTTLVYRGGGSLTFRDGAGDRRTILHGHSFEVDRPTAEILLRDPSVVPEDDILPRGNSAVQPDVDTGRPPDVGDVPPQIDVASAPKKDLLAYAALLGITVATKTKVDAVRASIEAELARRAELQAPLVDEAAVAANGLASDSDEGDQGGDGTSADDPDATAPGEAGTPPSDSTGAVTLGDLPASARVR